MTSYVQHSVVICDGFIELSNNDDSWYTQRFKNREEVKQFIAELQLRMDELWPVGVDPQELQAQCQKQREEERLEYLRLNPSKPPMTEEEILEHNRKLDALPGSSLGKNYITPPSVMKKLASDNFKIIR